MIGAILLTTTWALTLNPAASAEPSYGNDALADYMRDSAAGDCTIMSPNPFDEELLSTAIKANALIYGVSGREALGLMTEGARLMCPNVYEQWEYGPVPKS